MKNKLFRPEGLPILSAPVTGKDRVNNRARGILDLGRVSGAQLLQAAGYSDGPLLFCGSQSQAFPVIRQAALASGKPFLLVGTECALQDSCFLFLEPEWTKRSASPSLPAGNGCLMLRPGQQTRLDLKESLPEWSNRYVILLPGNGLQLDGNDLDMLNAIGSYALVTDSINRCFAVSGDSSVSLPRVYESMELILCRSVGSGVRELISVLPTFQMVKTVNTMDYSSYRNGIGSMLGVPMRGKGLRLSQARNIETMPILEESQFMEALERNGTVAVCMAKRRAFVADYR